MEPVNSIPQLQELDVIIQSSDLIDQKIARIRQWIATNRPFVREHQMCHRPLLFLAGRISHFPYDLVSELISLTTVKKRAREGEPAPEPAVKRPRITGQSIEKFFHLIHQSGIEGLEHTLAAYRTFLTNFHNPGWAKNFRTLSCHVLKQNRADLASKLDDYADGFLLLPELLNLIVEYAVQSFETTEWSGLRSTSHQVRRMAMEAFRGPLSDLGIDTAGRAIAHAHEFGSTLTYLDLYEIPFSEEKFQTLVPLLPKVKELYACCCELRGFVPDTFENLGSLYLSYNYLEDEGVEAFARSPNLGKIQTLSLLGNDFGAAGTIAIATSPIFTNLRSLYLDRIEIGLEGTRALATSSTLTNLQSLSLCDTSLNIENVRLLSTSKTLSNLKELLLAYTSLGDVAIQEIACSKTFQRLTKLDLSHTNTGVFGARALASSQTLTHLETLILGQNPLTGEGVQAIAGSQTLRCLKQLSLYSTGAGIAGARAIAVSQALANLQILDLSNNGFEDEGVREIAKSKTLTNLRKLFLLSNHIGDSGAAAISLAHNFIKLEKLYLNDNPISDAGALALLRSAKLPHLRKLNIDSDKMSVGEDLKRIEDAITLPNLRTLIISRRLIYRTS